MKDDFLKEKFNNFLVLVDEFNYEKNSIDDTKYFIKYLLYEFYYAARKPISVAERIKKLKKDSK